MNDRRKFHTYTVSPRGVLARLSNSGEQELRFQARISRNDGCSRMQEVVVRNTTDRPTLIDEVETALARAGGVRLVVEFVRGADLSGPNPAIRTIALVESIFGSKPIAETRQMDLFA
jgi:hypothetical protein